VRKINENLIISQNIRKDPKRDRLIQIIILEILNYIHSNYGFTQIRLEDLYKIINKYFILSKIDESINQNEIQEYILGFQNYELTNSVENKIMNTVPFEFIKEDTFFTINYENIKKSTNEMYNLYNPILLKEEIQIQNKKLEEYKNLEISFLSTSRLFEKREISKKLANIINNAENHIYMMLSFYQEDVLFFSDFLINKVLNTGVDLRIIYNPNDIKNEDFIRLLIKGIGLEDLDFFRAYGSLYLKDSKKKFVGNLHSKTVMTESELLVGSANLTAMSLYHNVENALYTNHQVSVKQANDFFDSLWIKLRPPNAI